VNEKQLSQFNISTDAKHIECPDCNKWSTVNEWDSDVFSWGDCEESVCMQCPVCEETFDRDINHQFNYK